MNENDFRDVAALMAMWALINQCGVDDEEKILKRLGRALRDEASGTQAEIASTRSAYRGADSWRV